MDFNHISVLRDECIEYLNINPRGVYVDGTLGGAGHSLVILDTLSGEGKLIGIDRDLEALNVARDRLKAFGNFIPVHDNFFNIKEILKRLDVTGIDGMLLDLGVSSYQIDNAERGFSYMHDGPLDMRMNKEDKITAKDVINNYTEEELIKMFFDYGEEKYSKSIAKRIIEARKEKEITTTFELIEIIKKGMPKKALNEKGHPAKRIFQAIRIEVNGELDTLANAVKDGIESLKPKGRMCIITFHSLEDRVIKRTFEDMAGKCTCPKDFPKCICGYKSYGKIITKKPILPNKEEMENNTRSKSAKLRVFERV